MRADVASVIGRRTRQGHELVIEATHQLTEEQLRWRANTVSPSIGFHLWHLARWADRIQAVIPGLTPELGNRLGPGCELWEAENLATSWDLAPETLGHHQSGTGMGDDQSAALVLPPKEVLLDYAARAFAMVDGAIAAVDDGEFFERGPCVNATGELTEVGVGDLVTLHLTHVSRHLGTIECLRGVQGEPDPSQCHQ